MMETDDVTPRTRSPKRWPDAKSSDHPNLLSEALNLLEPFATTRACSPKRWDALCL